MEQHIAADLIEKGVSGKFVQQWADLGAGTGVFTRALASLLKPQSTIYAVDTNKEVLGRISLPSAVSLKKVVGDLTDEQLIPSMLDGILLANAIHYVDEKRSLFSLLIGKLNEQGRIIIVEYDMERPNQWVPYPMPFRSLVELTSAIGLAPPREIGRTPSRLNASEMYAAVILK